MLFSLPALLSNGLLYKNEDYFQLPSGFYGLTSLLLILAFLVLLRVKSLEGVRYMPPGELGKLVGLDRIPEVKTLREKVGILKDSDNVSCWQNDLSRYWMESSPDLSGYLYVDGHVRIYFGKRKQTKLPRRYVSRERLCLRGMTDYWVNDALGQPFFVVTTALTSGLLSMLRRDIIPRLLKDVPNQPSCEALARDSYLYRFVIIFDREGYSPSFFEEMFVTHRIACITYKKYPGDDWPAEEFEEKEVVFKNGEKVMMKLAERRLNISETFWLREIRRLSKNGHQTSILSSNYKSERIEIAAAMFQRWTQENFFKYMLQHYGIDRLIEYETQPISETALVVNPQYRAIDSQIRKRNSKLTRLHAEFGSKTLINIDQDKDVLRYEKQMAELQEQIAFEQKAINELKQQRKSLPKHISISQLSEDDKFSQLAIEKKHFIDTIKMIAYRAETALANIIRPYMARKDEARSLVRQIFNTEINLVPDQKNKQLTVELHNLASEYSDNLAKIICNALNETEVTFPGTDMKLFYKMVSEKNPRSQEV
ncbi:MAG: hypothetical protein GTN68_40050 [Candidatus Aminicenantes bacterium]|nr:hypothetical protein [Candidatus Aminicenantes bacterium]NIN23501.1 hypothetical protein [Candidatus Aminicenantes bacterium]NIO86759.1 hypothetical protein [Candidatus Aminicenantes bacterium]